MHNEKGRLEPGQTCNQSKISWVLGTFKSLKSAGRDEIALVQQGKEHIVPHL
jgi:hypothetical protein